MGRRKPITVKIEGKWAEFLPCPWYAIVGHERSGSTALCDELISTRQVGMPGEWLNSYHRPPSHLDDYLVFLRMAQQIPKVFGYHLFNHDDMLTAWKRQEVKPRYVRLHREDKVAAAVSASIATQTKRFHRYQETDKKPHYSRREIGRYIDRMKRSDAFWDEFLEGEEVLDLTFEELLASMPEAVTRILRFLGVWKESEHEYGRDFDVKLKKQWRKRWKAGR